MVDNVFQFQYKKNDTTYYYVEGNNVLESTDEKNILDGPAGWSDITLQYVRHELLWGIFTKFALDLQFVLDGQKILRKIFYEQGYEGVCIFVIKKRNFTTGLYEFWTDGEIDFSEANDEKDFFGVSIKQRGLPEFIENKKDTTFEVPIDVVSSKGIRLDGIKIRGTINWTPVSYVAPASFASPDLTMLYRTSDIGKRYVPDNIPALTNANSVVSGGDDESIPLREFSNNYFYEATTTDPFTIRYGHYRIYFSQSPLIPQELFILVTDSDGAFVETIFLQGADIFGIINSSISEIEITPEIGYRYTLCLGGDPTHQPPAGGNFFSVSDYDEDSKATFELDYVIRLPRTSCFSRHYIDFAKALVEQASEGEFSVVSDFLSNTDTGTLARRRNWDSSPKWSMVTSAQAIRRDVDAPIAKVTMSQMFKDLWSRYMLAVGVEGNNLRIEPLSYFLQNTELFEVTDINNETISIQKDKIYNNIKVGYEDNTYDELSGRDEFNSTQEYALPEVKRISQQDDLIAPFRSDMYGIEWLRNKKNQEAAEDPYVKTKDDVSDNDTFVIEVDPVMHPDGIWLVYRPDGLIEGLEDPDTAYNIVHSPKRMLYRHFRRIRSYISKGIAAFQTSDKNADLMSRFFTTTIIGEKFGVTLESDTASGNNVSPLYKPFVIEFDGVPPISLAEIMSISMNGYIRFRIRGVSLKGFILDIGVIPATQDKYRFKVLCHPENDLSNLI